MKFCPSVVIALALLSACTTGTGTGQVHSDKLYVKGCWNGKFDLNPTFFGANPDRAQSLLIRVQRGDNIEEVSDGLVVLVNDIQTIRNSMIGQDITDVGLPPGIRIPGFTQSAAVPLVSMSLYLHDTCHVQNGTLYAMNGSINFASLFSGDPNEPVADKRLTDATFTAEFADPRELAGTGTITEASTACADAPDLCSTVTGSFRFYFQRGQPAQPFP